jgi:peroxiredoxin
MISHLLALAVENQFQTGSLSIGQAAPDFELKAMGSSQTWKLSAQRGKPVVLIFGSYT